MCWDEKFAYKGIKVCFLETKQFIILVHTHRIKQTFRSNQKQRKVWQTTLQTNSFRKYSRNMKTYFHYLRVITYDRSKWTFFCLNYHSLKPICTLTYCNTWKGGGKNDNWYIAHHFLLQKYPVNDTKCVQYWIRLNECECTHTRFIATALTFCPLYTCAHRMQSTLRWKKETQQLAGMASAPMIRISLSYYRNGPKYHQLVWKALLLLRKMAECLLPGENLGIGVHQ